jgi:hypothetical protein
VGKALTVTAGVAGGILGGYLLNKYLTNQGGVYDEVITLASSRWIRNSKEITL